MQSRRSKGLNKVSAASLRGRTQPDVRGFLAGFDGFAPSRWLSFRKVHSGCEKRSRSCLKISVCFARVVTKMEDAGRANARALRTEAAHRAGRRRQRARAAPDRDVAGLVSGSRDLDSQDAAEAQR